MLFTLLGLGGLWSLWKNDRRAGVAALALLGTLSIGLVYYMNFKYGFSQYSGEELPREVRERDYFFIGSFAVFGTFVALGFGALMQYGRGISSRSWHRCDSMGSGQSGPGTRADTPPRQSSYRQPGP